MPWNWNRLAPSPKSISVRDEVKRWVNVVKRGKSKLGTEGGERIKKEVHIYIQMRGESEREDNCGSRLNEVK